MIIPLVLLCAACFACGLVLGVIAMSVATAMTEQERRDGEEQSLAEEGRRLASWRDDLIAQGVDPADLAVPLYPTEDDPA